MYSLTGLFIFSSRHFTLQGESAHEEVRNKFCGRAEPRNLTVCWEVFIYLPGEKSHHLQS